MPTLIAMFLFILPTSAAAPCDPEEAVLEVFGIDDLTSKPDPLVCDLWERGYTCGLSSDGNTETCCTPYNKEQFHNIPTKTCCSNTNGENTVTCTKVTQPPPRI